MKALVDGDVFCEPVLLVAAVKARHRIVHYDLRENGSNALTNLELLLCDQPFTVYKLKFQPANIVIVSFRLSS